MKHASALTVSLFEKTAGKNDRQRIHGFTRLCVKAGKYIRIKFCNKKVIFTCIPKGIFAFGISLANAAGESKSIFIY